MTESDNYPQPASTISHDSETMLGGKNSVQGLSCYSYYLLALKQCLHLSQPNTLCILRSFHDVLALADPRGGARDVRPPQDQNSFIFIQFSAKNLQNNSIFWSWRTPWENPGSATGLCHFSIR